MKFFIGRVRITSEKHGLRRHVLEVKMSTEFRYFLDVIPPDMYARTKATICRYIAVFEPEEYALGEVISRDDLSFPSDFRQCYVNRHL